jgi:uncharacterized protein YllA (UPF0747 family)
LIVDKKNQKLLKKLNLIAVDLFKGKEILLNDIVNAESHSVLNLDKQKIAFENIYEEVKAISKDIDPTLETHTSTLETKHLKRIDLLEKKMLRAEKRKFSDQKNQLDKIFSALFPEGGLQERTENFMLFYSYWGNGFFKALYENSLTLEQEFCIITSDENKDINE